MVIVKVKEVTDSHIVYTLEACILNDTKFLVQGKRVILLGNKNLDVSLIKGQMNRSRIVKKVKSYYPHQIRKFIIVEDVRDYIKNQDNKR